MKKNKGFTLVELLGVLTILALLLLLAFPNFTKLTSNANSNYDRSNRVLVRSAARMYIDNNEEEVKQAIQANGRYCLPIGKLIAYEYLDSNLKSASKTYDKDKVVIIKFKDNEYQIDPDPNPDDDPTTASSCGINDYLPPIITISKKGDTQCGSVTTVQAATLDDAITTFDTDCKVEVTDNKLSTPVQFQGIKISEVNKKVNDLTLNKTLYQDEKDPNKIYITYNAADEAGNKAIPLKIQLIRQDN